MFREAIVPTFSELISAPRRLYPRSVSKVKEEQGRSYLLIDKEMLRSGLL